MAEHKIGISSDIDKRLRDKLHTLDIDCYEDLLNVRPSSSSAHKLQDYDINILKLRALQEIYPRYNVGYKILLSDMLNKNEQDRFKGLGWVDFENLKTNMDRLIQKELSEYDANILIHYYGLQGRKRFSDSDDLAKLLKIGVYDVEDSIKWSLAVLSGTTRYKQRLGKIKEIDEETRLIKELQKKNYLELIKNVKDMQIYTDNNTTEKSLEKVSFEEQMRLLGVSTRAYNALRRFGVDNLEKLKNISIYEFSKEKNVGANTLEEVKHLITELKANN